MHFLDGMLRTQSVPPVEAPLAPTQVLQLTESRLFSSPGILSSSPLHTPRATPGTKDRCVQAHRARAALASGNQKSRTEPQPLPSES